MKAKWLMQSIKLLLLLCGIGVLGQQMENALTGGIPVVIPVNGESVIKTGIKNPSGAVICWLLDSEIERPRNRSMENALGEMKAGVLRFPYVGLCTE